MLSDFRRSPEVLSGAVYRRFRGAGGDGGVEVIWRFPDAGVWELQSKFFWSLGNAEKEQMRGSVQQAIQNYTYSDTFALLIQLTGRGAGGKGKEGQTEKMESWIKEWCTNAAARGVSLEIDWWDATQRPPTGDGSLRRASSLSV